MAFGLFLTIFFSDSYSFFSSLSDQHADGTCRLFYQQGDVVSVVLSRGTLSGQREGGTDK